jgi:predicted nucleotidyltransferase
MIEVLFPRVRRSVLALLLGQPDRRFHLREIVRAVNGGKGAVERELRSLSAAGIISREELGGLVLFKADRSCPVFPELHMLMIKTLGVADVIRHALEPLEGISLAFIFGSIAQGTEDSRSDVDLLIVGSATYSDIASTLQLPQKTLGREISPMIYSDDEFRQRITEGHHFLAGVLQKPRIFLIGGDDDIRRMG